MTRGACTLRPLCWWQLSAVDDIERDLFGAEAWPATLFWSELAQADTRHYLVALEDEQVIGYAGLCAYPEEAYVQTLAVRRDRHGAGIGTALLLALLHEAARRGLDVVGLEVRADNPRAQALYRRFGFAAVGLRPRYYQPSGTDAVVMLLSGLRHRLAGLEATGPR